jgi:hypothetical protein
MAFDPSNPPIWLRKLHVTAAQIDPSDYAPTPEEGILRVCRLSDDMYVLSKAFAEALGFAPFAPPDPFVNPFSLNASPPIDQDSDSRKGDVAR